MEGLDASASGGLGEADAVAGGDDEVGVVEEPVDGGVGDRLGHQLVEPGRMEVGGQGDAALLVGGVHDPVEGLGGVGRNREQPDVIDQDQVGVEDLAEGPAGGVVGPVAADDVAELLEAEPQDVGAVVDRGVAERFEEVALPGARRAADDEVLVVGDPLQGP